jgi:imidazolonepropionase-like amidohydrolase
VFSHTPGVALAGILEQATSGRRLAIVGGTVIDGTGAAPRLDGVVLVEDGWITAVGDASAVDVTGAEVIDATGRFVIPGLIDCHLHLTGDTTIDMYRRYFTPSPDVRLFHALRQSTTALSRGFTTVRDVGLGSAVAIRNAQRSGWVVAPRILAANSAISITGGHGDWTLFPLDLVRSQQLRGTIADGVEECLRAVRRAFREGADLIKVMPSGGGVTNHADDLAAYPEMSLEELTAITQETHRRGARVAAHTNGEGGVRLAIEGGVDTVEHGVFEPDPEILDTMAARGISLVPTLLIFRWVVEEGAAAGVFAEGIEAAKKLLEVQFRLVAAAHAAGVNVAVGTDNTGVMRLDTNARELWLLQQTGLSAMDALRAATEKAAIACGIEETVGTIERGKLGDLLVLEHDPLLDLTTLWADRGIRTIVQARPAVN